MPHAALIYEDAAKFGQTYLSKFGWDSSQGLGVLGEGRTKAISVDHKLDLLGIGMQHRNSEGGVAWKQNKDFEKLLRRLNGESEEGEGSSGTKIEGFDRAKGEEDDEERVEGAEESNQEEAKVGEKESRRKRKKSVDDGGNDGEESKEKKKRKKSKDIAGPAENESKKEKRKKKKSKSDDEEPSASSSNIPTPVEISSTLR